MANHPHPGDDQAHHPDGAKKNPATPKRPIPNMEIEEALEVEEVFEEGVPIVEAAPASEVEPFVLSDDDVVAEEVIEVMPEDEVVEAMPVAEPVTAAPASDVSLTQLFGDEPAAKAAHPTPPPMPMADLAAAAIPVAEPVHDHVWDEPIVEAAALSDVVAEEVVEEAAPESEVFAAEEVIEEAAPVSEVYAAEEVVEEAAPASEVIVAAEAPHAPPASEIIAAHEPIHSAPASEVIVAEEPMHSAPASEVVAAHEDVHHVPHSGVIAAAGVAPESVVVAAEEVEEFAEAEEIVEAEPASSVLFDEEIAEAAPVSEALSAEIAEEVAETVEEPSSATRRAEAVLEDEGAEAEAGSAVMFDSAAELAEAMPESAVEVAEAGSSAVLFDEGVEVGSAVTPTSAVSGSGRTLAYGGASSAAKRADSDVLVTEDDLAEATEASAVNLSGMTSRKGSSATGIDKVAEALESGVDLGSDPEMATAEAVPSVEFDELLDEHLEEESTEMDTEALAEAAEVYEETVTSKKKSKVRGTGDDIDLDELFDEEEVAEAADAEDAEPAEAVDVEGGAEAEAAVAFDEEMEAAEAFDDDEKPAKKKSKKLAMEDDEEIAAAAEEEEGTSAKKKKGKKGKKDKELATAAAPAQGGGLLRILIGMALGIVILIGGAAAGVFLAPEQIHDLVNVGGPPAKSNDGQADRIKLAQAVADKAAVDKKLTDVTTERDTAKKELAAAEKKLESAVEIDKTLTEVKAELDASKKKQEAAEMKLDAAAKVLVDAKQIDDKSDFSDAALAKIIKSLGDDRKALADVNTLLKDADVKGMAGDGVKEVLKIKKGLEDNIAAVEKVLADEKTKGKLDKGVLEIVEARNQAAKDRDALLDTLTQAFKEFIDGKIVAADADPRKQIVEGAKIARQKAESPLSIPLAQLGMSLGNVGVGAGKVIEQTFGAAKLATELGWFQGREKFIETPQQKMSTYIALLQDRSQTDAKRLADIRREADWVRTPESRSSVEDQAKARYVQGLALRNREKFAEAKAAFADAIKMTNAGWTAGARMAERELTDPNEYYLPKMRKLLAAGNANAALAEANLALKAIPGNAILHAERGHIRLDLIRGQGPKIADDVQEAIKADAKAAEKDAKFAAEAAFIVGLLDEELAHWPEAEKQYREAIKLHEDSKAPANEGGKYRVALARLLLRDRTEPADVPTPAPNADEKKKDASADPVERTIVMHPWSLLVVASVVAQPVEDPEDPANTARYKEAVEQAKKLIASDDKDLKGAGYLALGKAQSKMGQRTEGLKNFAEGLRLIYPGLSTKDLKDLIDQHPAFQQPDSADTPNPLMSERHFGEGIHLYWAKKYPEAEAQFRQAVKYYDKDARYQYFLGLAQLQQKTLLKRDQADFAFQRGANLEAKAAQSNPDAVREINASLERIQGELRQQLNNYRYKAMSSEPEGKK